MIGTVSVLTRIIHRPSIGVRHQYSLIDLDDSLPEVRTDVQEQECIQCEKHTSDLCYCNVCQYSFCSKCWGRQVTHKNKQRAPGDVPHEKTNYEVAMKIKQVLESDITEMEQEHMHNKDENTTWFGIIREKGEMPLFQDYGRYAQIMSDITSRDAHGAPETRYPGMVSFVGQTGTACCIKLAITINQL